MERTAWTDDRIGDFSNRVDARFDAVDRRFDRVDTRFDQVNARFEQVDARFEQVDKRFDRMDARFDRLEDSVATLRTELHGDINKLKLVLVQVSGGIVAALLGIIAAILLKS
jgi:archaellum component FlaC